MTLAIKISDSNNDFVTYYYFLIFLHLVNKLAVAQGFAWLSVLDPKIMPFFDKVYDFVKIVLFQSVSYHHSKFYRNQYRHFGVKKYSRTYKLSRIFPRSSSFYSNSLTNKDNICYNF